MAKKLTENQKKEIIKNFTNGISIDKLSEIYNFSKLTISRNIKKIIGEKVYKDLIKKSKNHANSIDEDKNNKELINQDLPDKIKSNYEFNIKLNDQASFVEIVPLDYEIENHNQKDLSSIPVSEKIIIIIPITKVKIFNLE